MAAIYALRESATVSAKIDQNVARRCMPEILGLISKTAFGSGDIPLPKFVLVHLPLSLHDYENTIFIKMGGC